MNDCVEWQGPSVTTHGNTYGRLRGKKMRLVHRVVYEWVHGPIPEGLVIDHLCRNGLCYNVNHLEAVSNKENILRGNGFAAKNARKTHCHRGHELNDQNVWKRKNGKRDCKVCDRIRRQR